MVDNLLEKTIHIQSMIRKRVFVLAKKSCSAYSKTMYIDLSSSMTSFKATTFSWSISRLSYMSNRSEYKEGLNYIGDHTNRNFTYCTLAYPSVRRNLSLLIWLELLNCIEPSV